MSKASTPKERARQLGLSELHIAQIVKIVGIPKKTLFDWFTRSPERFDEAIKEAKKKWESIKK